MNVVSHARGRLGRCELWGNANGGVIVWEGGDPTLAACTLRDHATGIYPADGCGVYVAFSSHGKVTVGADCVFARNARGGIVRQTEEEAAAEMEEVMGEEGGDEEGEGEEDAAEEEELV